MPEFKVRLRVFQYDTYLVEAESEQEAVVMRELDPDVARICAPYLASSKGS